MAEISADGTYQLSSYEKGDGIPAGEYKVALECVEYPKMDEVLPKTFAEELAGEGKSLLARPKKGPTWYVPETFASPETSNLKVTIASGTNTIDFELPQ